MELKQLRVFQTIARCGSVVLAAGELHLTASALSHALKALETELGCPLFERTGRNLQLNPAGQQFLAHIQPHLTGLRTAAEELRQRIGQRPARLRLAAAPSACKHILPSVIRDLQKAFPNVAVRIETGDTPEVFEMLKANAADLGLGVVPESVPTYRTHPVFRDELLFTFAPSHRWADGQPLTAAELRSQPFILYRRRSVSVRFIENYLRDLGVAAPQIMEVGSMEAIKEFVRLGLGVAVLPPWVAERELRRGILKMRPLGRAPLRRDWAIFHRSSRRLTPVEGRFIRLCRAHAAGMRLDRKDLTRGTRG